MDLATTPANWAHTILRGVFGEEANIMRCEPRDPKKKVFSRDLLLVAQGKYLQQCLEIISNVYSEFLTYFTNPRPLPIVAGRKCVEEGRGGGE